MSRNELVTISGELSPAPEYIANLTMEVNFNELKKENEAIRKMINSKDKKFEEIVQVEGTSKENQMDYLCDKCDFIGKTESGLKVHKTAKHKVNYCGYRKFNLL